MIYLREVFRSVNKKTGAVRYYMTVCNTSRRISKAHYDMFYRQADGIDTVFTKETAHARRHYVTLRYYEGKAALVGLKPKGASNETHL